MLGRAQLGSLEVLSVAGAYRLDDKGLQAVLKATPKLLVLGLQDSCRLQDSISVLPSCCPSLKAGPFPPPESSTYECREITEAGPQEAFRPRISVS